MQRTNLPTLVAIVIAIGLAGALVWVSMKDSTETTAKDTGGGGKKFQEVTELAAPVEFQLVKVPAGETVDLTATLRSPRGKEVELAELTGDRALILYLDTDAKDRRLRAITRDLQQVIKGVAELKLPIILILPQGTSATAASDFLRARRLHIPAFVDADGEFAEGTGWPVRSAALVDGAGTIILEFGPAARWDDRFGFMPPLTDDVLFWAWDIPEKGPEVSREAKTAATKLVREALTAGGVGDEIPAGLSALVADPSLAAAPEHDVYVSLFRPGETERLRGAASEGTLGERVALATGGAMESARDRDEWEENASEIRFMVDVLGPAFPIPGREMRSLWYFLEPGVDGLEVVNGGDSGVVLPAEAVTQGFLSPRVTKRDEKLPRLLSEGCKRAGLGGKAWESAETDLRRFRTTSFGEVLPGEGAVDLYRGNVLIGDQSSEDILEVIRLGGRWLLQTVKPDGTFDYEYYPNTDKSSRDYSWVRHAGSVYGLFEMAELAHHEPYLRDDLNDYMEAGVISVGGVYSRLEVVPQAKTDDRYCLLDRGGCESGSAALSLMTYLSRPPREHISDPEHVAVLYRENDQEVMDGLALTMIDMIDEDGKVFRTYAQAVSLDKVEKEPLYYPGEVMLALTRYYQLTGDERWLDGAKAIASNQMRIYRKNRWSNPDHWVMQALYLLFHSTGDAEYAEVALEMGTHHASEQFGGPHVSPFPDYRGAYRRTNDVPRTTRAGSRTEAMMGVVRTAWEMGVDATIYEDAVLQATRHMSEQIFRPDTVFWMANSPRALGALRMGIVDNHCRIDNNQHALVGIAGALEVQRKRESIRKE